MANTNCIIKKLQEERDKLKKKHEQILEDSERLLQSYNDLSQQRINVKAFQTIRRVDSRGFS